MNPFQFGSCTPSTALVVSGCLVMMLFSQVPRRVRPVAKSTPTPIAPWCRLALPPDWRVGKRSMAITGYPAVLDQRAVAMAAQGVQAGEDAGDLMLDFLMADDLAGHRAIAPLKAVGDDEDAVTAGALGRLDHEVAAPANDLVELVDFLLGGDHPVHFRHVDAGRQGPFLGDDLVIHDRVQAALVVLEHVVGVTPVDAHDAARFQGLPGLPEAEHYESALRKALKRTNSVRR